MTPHEKAHELLPKLPPEAYDAWLSPLVVDHGWPFHGINDAFPTTQWHDYFLGQPLHFWATLNWERRQMTISQCIFHPSTTRLVRLLSDYFRGDNSSHFLLKSIKDTKGRVARALTHANTTGTLPGVLVGIETADGIRMADGNHRLAAAMTSAPRLQTRFTIWLGHQRV
jgi:hypothetical protein